jgi:acyl-CoA thioester hydrolase
MPRTKLDLPAIFEFSTDIPVRITDINYGGHLGNDSLLSILQEARLRFLRQYAYSEKDVEGRGIIMLDAVVVYKSEAFYGDVLRVEVAVADVVNHGCDLLYRVTNKATGKEVSCAKTSIAFFDYDRRKVVGVPEGFRAKFSSSQPTA